MSFFKFPRTPHLFVIPGLDIRDDKVVPESEAEKFYKSPVIVEEKVDGANVGISFENNELKFQNRGNYILSGGQPQFEPIWDWGYKRLHQLSDILQDRYIVFGEWCYAEHSIHYTRLPDWFIGFDVYDRMERMFLPVVNRNRFFDLCNITPVPLLGEKKLSKTDIIRLVNNEQSRLGGGLLEGVYIRLESKNMLVARAKVVRKDFIQDIGEHWSKKRLVKNELIG